MFADAALAGRRHSMVETQAGSTSGQRSWQPSRMEQAMTFRRATKAASPSQAGLTAIMSRLVKAMMI
jgi:hypothetical protein